MGSGDGGLHEWNMATDSSRLYKGHTDVISSVAYSPDGKRILSASRDKAVREWDRHTAECLRALPIPPNDESRITRIAYVHNDSLITAHTLGAVYSWNRSRDTAEVFEFYETNDDDWIDNENGKKGDGFDGSYYRDYDEENNRKKTAEPFRNVDFDLDNDIRDNIEGLADDGYTLYRVTNLDGGLIGEWDARTQSSRWSVPAYSGIFIAGCGFKGCRYQSDEIEAALYGFGGLTDKQIRREQPHAEPEALNADVDFDRHYKLFDEAEELYR
jgi:WD40 repeat protein